jgi:hypothetical protein
MPEIESIEWSAPAHGATVTGARPRTRSSSAPPPPLAASPVATTASPSRDRALAPGAHSIPKRPTTSGTGTTHALPPDGVLRSRRAESGETGDRRRAFRASVASGDSAS